MNKEEIIAGLRSKLTKAKEDVTDYESLLKLAELCTEICPACGYLKVADEKERRFGFCNGMCMYW